MNLRLEVLAANKSLKELGLVCMHSGNVSAIDRTASVVYIKPSGMDYDELSEPDIVTTDLLGNAFKSFWKPSVDLPHHLYLYQNMPEIGGVVHTHSNYATAFAACHTPIPAALTAVADEFGGEIPCAPYVDNIGSNIGEAILQYRNQAPAILLGNHGVFAWGPSVSEALKAAAMVEDVAKTIAIAMGVGQIKLLPEEEIAKWNDRYLNRYGQWIERQ